jgi:hypothetical protein
MRDGRSSERVQPETEMSLNSAGTTGISVFVGQLVDRFPAMRSIWMIGNRANGEALDSPGPFDWDLVAFADTPTLHRLRKATDLHRVDVLLRVVTDGDRFEVAWGKLRVSGSLFQWDWCQANGKEAYYSEARWKGRAETGNVERTRRKAACVWRSMPVSASRYTS